MRPAWVSTAAAAVAAMVLRSRTLEEVRGCMAAKRMAAERIAVVAEEQQ